MEFVIDCGNPPSEDFVKNYKKDFNNMTKDWFVLVKKLFDSKTKDSNAKKMIFNRSVGLRDSWKKNS